MGKKKTNKRLENVVNRLSILRNEEIYNQACSIKYYECGGHSPRQNLVDNLLFNDFAIVRRSLKS